MMLGNLAESELKKKKKSAPNEARGIIDQLWGCVNLSHAATARPVGFLLEKYKSLK